MSSLVSYFLFSSQHNTPDNSCSLSLTCQQIQGLAVELVADLPLLVLEKILILVDEELDEERKIPLKLRRRGDFGGEF